MFIHRRGLGLLLGGAGALALGAVPAVAAAAPGPQVAVAGAVSPGAGGARVGSVPGAQPVSFRINLGLRDEAGAERYAVAAASSGNPLSGRFLSESQFQVRFGPSATDVASLEVWLHMRGLTVDDTVGDQMILAHGSAGRVAAAFSTRLAQVRSGGAVATSAVTPLRVPARFAGLVQGVSGLRPTPEFTSHDVRGRTLYRIPAAQVAAAAAPTPAPRASAAAPANPACPTYFGQVPAVGPHAPFSTSTTSVQECSVFTDPVTGRPLVLPGANYTKVRTLSSVDPRYTGGGTTVGVVLWNNDPTALSSANIAAKANRTQPFRPGQFTSVINNTRVRGCQPTAEDDKGEINLDIQSVHAFAPNANVRFYGSSSCVIPEISLAQAVGERVPPTVLTNSWGFTNTDYDPSSPTARSIHTTLVKAAVRGISVIFSSGDTGDGTVLRAQYPRLSPPAPYPARTPSYPATDPYVTAVGGVGFGISALGRVAFKQAWTPQYLVGNGSSAWRPLRDNQLSDSPNVIGTGGGVSRAFAAPTWQRAAGITAGRTIPDIANAADLFFLPLVVAQNTGGEVDLFGVGGTSVAAPLTAGQLANAAALQHRPYLGVITPSLYRYRGTSVTSDVVRFQSTVSVQLAKASYLLVGGERPDESLVTRPGYDNATGLGVPGTGFLSRAGH